MTLFCYVRISLEMKIVTGDINFSGLKRSVRGSIQRKLFVLSSSCTGRGLFTGMWCQCRGFNYFCGWSHTQTNCHFFQQFYTQNFWPVRFLCNKLKKQSSKLLKYFQRFKAGQSASGLRGSYQTCWLWYVQTPNISW